MPRRLSLYQRNEGREGPSDIISSSPLPSHIEANHHRGVDCGIPHPCYFPRFPRMPKLTPGPEQPFLTFVPLCCLGVHMVLWWACDWLLLAPKFGITFLKGTLRVSCTHSPLARSPSATGAHCNHRLKRNVESGSLRAPTKSAKARQTFSICLTLYYMVVIFFMKTLSWVFYSWALHHSNPATPDHLAKSLLPNPTRCAPCVLNSVILASSFLCKNQWIPSLPTPWMHSDTLALWKGDERWYCCRPASVDLTGNISPALTLNLQHIFLWWVLVSSSTLESLVWSSGIWIDSRPCHLCVWPLTNHFTIQISVFASVKLKGLLCYMAFKVPSNTKSVLSPPPHFPSKI